MPADQHGVINLMGGELHLMGEHVEQVLALILNGHHAVQVLKPQADVTSHGCRTGIAPAVAVHKAITGHQHIGARSVGDADQGLGALGLAVFVKADRRLNAAGGLAAAVH